MSFCYNRRRPTFPGSCPPSIIGAKELNYCVRDGNRWILFAIVTGLFEVVPSKLNNVYISKSSLVQLIFLAYALNHLLMLETIGQAFDLLVSVS